jgi:hypothetical protein
LQFVKVDVARGVATETFVLHADGSRQIAVPHDVRRLNYRVTRAIMGSSASACPHTIVNDGSPVALGANWYGLETSGADTFRWATNDAVVQLTKAQAKPFTLEAELEPGPSLGGAPLTVAVENARGTVLATTAPIAGRNAVRATLPPMPSGSTLRFVVHSKGVEVPHDRRLLNFRIYTLKILPQS